MYLPVDVPLHVADVAHDVRQDAIEERMLEGFREENDPNRRTHPMPPCRWDHCAARMSTREIVVFGGWDGDRWLNDTFVLQFGTFFFLDFFFISIC